MVELGIEDLNSGGSIGFDNWTSKENRDVLEVFTQKVGYLIEKVVKMIYKKFDIVLVGSKSFIRIVRQRVPHNRVYYFPNWAENIIEENKIGE